MLPRNVRRFAWLWVISFLLALPGILVIPTPSPSMVKLGITRSVEMELEFGVAALIFAVLLPFFWLAVWKRANWARWVLFVAFVVPMPLLFLKPSLLFRPDHIPTTLIEYASTLVEIAAFYFLYTGDARHWFRREDLN